MLQTRTPPLDTSLKADCAKLSHPPDGDYDALQGWVQDEVLPKYGDCASRHHRTVIAWPK